MFKSIKKFICNLFNIKACKCKDEHLEFYEDVPEPTIKVNHCDTHIRFIKSCSACLMSVMGEK